MKWMVGLAIVAAVIMQIVIFTGVAMRGGF